MQGTFLMINQVGSVNRTHIKFLREPCNHYCNRFIPYQSTITYCQFMNINRVFTRESTKWQEEAVCPHRSCQFFPFGIRTDKTTVTRTRSTLGTNLTFMTAVPAFTGFSFYRLPFGICADKSTVLRTRST